MHFESEGNESLRFVESMLNTAIDSFGFPLSLEFHLACSGISDRQDKVSLVITRREEVPLAVCLVQAVSNSDMRVEKVIIDTTGEDSDVDISEVAVDKKMEQRRLMTRAFIEELRTRYPDKNWAQTAALLGINQSYLSHFRSERRCLNAALAARILGKLSLDPEDSLAKVLRTIAEVDA